MPKPENIEPHKFKKGQSGNPNGRPRKYVSLLKEQGYKLSEINDTIQVMMAMDMEELKSVWDNPKATVLEKTIAAAIRKSIEKGSLYSIETLLTRVYGKPRENADVKTEMTIRLIDDDDTPTEAARSTDTGAE
jgi:tRNA A37 N6-isopentenylltransferase MiaA